MNGSVTPVSGITRITPPMITNVCTPTMVVRPAANSFENGRSAWIAMRNPLPTSSRNRMHTATVPIRPSSSPMADEHEVGRRVRDLLRAAEAEAGAREPAGAEREQRLHELEARRLRDRPRVDPELDAVLHVAEELVRDDGAGEEHAERDDEVRPAFGGDVEHRREHREEEERRPEVLLAHHHQDRERPTRASSGPRCFGSGRLQPPDAAGAGGEQLALVDEVRGEEDHEQHLGGLAGLEVDRPDAHPQPGAVDLAADARAASGSSSAATPSSRNVYR